MSPFATGVKLDHVPSGIAVLPVRIESCNAVSVGSVAVHAAIPQLVDAPASKILDVKLPDDAYGVIRNQSTDKVPSVVATSLICTNMF